MQQESADNEFLADAVGGTWSIDADSWRVRWSPRARSIHGVEPGTDPTVWQALDFIDAADRPMLFRHALMCARHGVPFDIEADLTSAQGQRKRVRIVGFPADSHARAHSMQGTISVVGRPVNPEGDVAVRDLLMSAQDWQLIGSGIPHELRGLLACIGGFAEAIARRETALSEQGRAWVQRIIAVGEHTDRLLDGLLHFAPLATVPVRKEPVHLSAIARDCVAALRDGEPGREVEVDVAPGIWATGDADLLRLVVCNLLSNAWKFTRTREHARIVFEEDTVGEQDVYVVRDNGIGFEMTDAARVFVPLQRLHSQEQFAGSGMGLAIVRRAIERHGGNVWAHAVPGEGASFFFHV